MHSYITDFFNLFFPKTCLICSEGLYTHEKYICKACENKLPKSNYHLTNNNPVEKLFWGRIDTQKVTSFLLYTKGNMAKHILHSIKYKNNKELGYELGKLYGNELNEKKFFAKIDAVIPVPLHPKKLSLRGYNQSEWIAKGFAETLGSELIADNLFKKSFTSTQTRKGRYERWVNISDDFDIRNISLFENKNILLVDDVLTTGATIEACARPILMAKGSTVNVVTLAYATI